MASQGWIVSETNAEQIAAWCGGRAVVQHDALDPDKLIPGVNVPVGDKVERAMIGDIVIRKNDGSYEIVKQ